MTHQENTDVSMRERVLIALRQESVDDGLDEVPATAIKSRFRDDEHRAVMRALLLLVSDGTVTVRTVNRIPRYAAATLPIDHDAASA